MKREFDVITPIGRIRVSAKHTLDCAQDYPGVYIKQVLDDGTEYLLACTEYDSARRDLMTCTYQPKQDEPVFITHHKPPKIKKVIVPCDVAIKRFYRITR